MFKVASKERAPRPKRLREGLPLSPNEERYLLAEELTGQVYIAPTATRIFGVIDIPGTEAAIRKTCERHEARRTGFERGADGQFTKYIEDQPQVRMKRIAMPGASEAEIRDAVRAYLYAKADYTPENLHRYLLIHLGPDDHVLAYGFHHATSDGVTANAFAMETFMRVMGFDNDAPPVQYSDYWNYDWRNSEPYRQAEAFWKDRMAGLEAGGQLPPDRRCARQPGARDVVRPGVMLPISAEVAAATKAAADEIGVSHFNFFYATYLVLLSRLTGAARVCTTFQSAGRRGKAGAEAAHGVFSNKLILGAPVREDESIRALAGRVRGEIRDAIAHEIFPYHHVIRATGVHPRFAINWYPSSHINTALADLRFESIDLVENQDDDDLNVRVFTFDQGMFLTLFHNPEVLSEVRARSIGEQLAALAGALAADVDRPTGEVRLADLAPPGLLPDPAATLAPAVGGPVFAAFLEQARATPDAVAIEHAGSRMTYAELEKASRATARSLQALGLAAADRVAILAERGPELVVAMLGALRVGALFAVLDAGHPEPYLASLAEIAAPQAILRAGRPDLDPLAERLAQPLRAATLAVSYDSTDAEVILQGLDEARADDPAYMLFTSGSTGRPKGVACSHAPLTDFLAWQARTFGLTAADRFSLAAGLSHDPVLRDIFGPLSIGATLLIPDQPLQAPGQLAAWLAASRATVAHLTPSMGQILTAGAPPALPALRRLFWGGEPLRPALAAAVADLAPAVEQVNFYGATETPQAAGAFRLDGDPDWATVPLGQGSEGFQLLVVDADGRPLGVGEPGEIAVRSARLSLGYVECGRIRSADDHILDATGAALYRTGDRGYHLPDGAVMFTGRADDQVKVRGHRVELAEVTAALAERAGVRAAAAVAVGDGDHPRIVGFVTTARGLDPETLKSSLAARLPGHLVPHEIRRLDALPLLPNGKVDRRALMALAAAGPALPPKPAANAVERSLMEAWSSLLGVKTISSEATFASLGGDSLSYVQAFLALEETIGEPPEDWPQMTIADLAARKTERGAAGVIDMPILVRCGSILLILAKHFNLIDYGGGATSLLMLVSGYMLGALALPEAFRRRSASPLLRNLVTILIPTAILSVALYAFRSFGHSPQLYILTLSADLQDWRRANPQDLYLWYAHCLLHLILFLYLAVLGLQMVKGFDLGLRRFLIGLFVVGCLGRFGLPWFLDHGFFDPRQSHLVMLYLLPTTHLATVALGGLAANVAARSERLFWSWVIVLYAAASAWCFGPMQAVFLLSALLLVTLPRVRLPNWARGAVLDVAGASLWLYLTHMMVRDGMLHLFGRPYPLAGFVIALGVGLGAWRLWRKAIATFGQAVGRPVPAAAEQPAI
ncbi:amino acid adenylation domain-containing protein [Phenylobacterium sp.]|jgi:amino acid adenylation domain-containing protein|uniref:amino acid adenylation domain-containing protein n=1 Tax=Phenylobacterium sp. TaxID=1871053 RepID=UPI002F406494